MNTTLFMNFQVLTYLFISLISAPDVQTLSNNLNNKVITYPKGEFVFPINPGRRASLSGSYGDIRFNHFHAGLDIRTGGVEGVAVHSAGDGYVSRIGVSGGGYGNALYITHPNGYTTVYGHLKEFGDRIKGKLLEREYQQQSWAIDTYFQPGEIPVSKGEVVAFSGNTGGSGGPHLHFEIRNQAEQTINPSLFGFEEIVDNVSPQIVTVTLKTMDINSRINGQFGEVTLTPVKLKNGDYILNNNITAHGKIGVMVYAYDKSETSPFRLGITQMTLKANDGEVYKFDLEKMSFDTKIDMNLHTDYEKMVGNGVKNHKLYVETGNRLNNYTTNAMNGQVEIKEEKVDFEVKLSDTFHNTTRLTFNVIPELSADLLIGDQSGTFAPKLIVNKFDNILRVQAIGAVDKNVSAIFQYRGEPITSQVAYKTANSLVYLYDLKAGLVDFVQVGNSNRKIDFNTYALLSNQFISEKNYQVNFQDARYDNLFLNFKENGSELTLDEDIYPLKSRFKVTWQTSFTNCDKCGVYLASTRRSKFISSEKAGADFTFYPKEFGTYKILQDDVPPTIRVRKINSSEISFNVSDNLSGIKNITCFVDNRWV
ncbi:MAG: M23 family metallopeptidase, partial [Spirosomataceae bacterium]